MEREFFGYLADFLENKGGFLVVNSANQQRHNLVRLLGGKYVKTQGGRELTLEEYEEVVGDFDVFDYGLLVALSKVLWRQYPQEGRYVLAVDTVNVINQGGRLVVMEKPSNFTEALQQLKQVMQGVFLNLNSAVVYNRDSGKWGFSSWVLPVCYEIPAEKRQAVWKTAVDKLEGLDHFCPGGLSGVDPVLIPYVRVGIFPEEVLHERVGDCGERRRLPGQISWFSLMSLPPAIREGLVMTVAGVSPFGVKRAGMRLLGEVGKLYRKRLEKLLTQIKEGQG